MHGFSEQNAISFFVDATTNILKNPDPLTEILKSFDHLNKAKCRVSVLVSKDTNSSQMWNMKKWA